MLRLNTQGGLAAWWRGTGIRRRLSSQLEAGRQKLGSYPHESSTTTELEQQFNCLVAL